MPATNHARPRMTVQTCRRCARPFDETAPLGHPVCVEGWTFGYGRCPACWEHLGPPPAATTPIMSSERMN